MPNDRHFARAILTSGLVLFGLVPALAVAQEGTTVSGRVTAAVAGSPLAGAIVSILMPTGRIGSPSRRASPVR